MKRWLTACNVDTMEALTELILMEQFRSCVSHEIDVYIAECGVQIVKEAAELADTWEVIHHGGIGRGYYDRGQDKLSSFSSSKPAVKRLGHDQPGQFGGLDGGKASRSGVQQGGGGQRLPERFVQNGRGGHGSRQDIICHHC